MLHGDFTWGLGGTLQITTLNIADLSADPANVRKHDERNIATIMGSLRRFGQQKPIVVDMSNVVRAGNGTLEAAKRIGWETIEAYVSDLTGSEMTAYAIADNRTAELAEWDDSALAAVLEGLQFDDDALLEAAGFDEDELAALMADIDLPDDEPITEDEVPEPPVDPITKTGDLWILGRHRVLCGDSTKAEDVGRLMNGASVASVVTDPPYGMAFQSNYRKEKHAEIAGDGDGRLLEFAIGITAEHSKYIWCRWDNIPKAPKPKSAITWAKNNWSMGDLEHEHARQTEVCLFWPGDKHKWTNGRPTDLVTHARTGNELHPTQKPVSLMAEVVKWTDGNVYDPFLGSGTTLIAAEQLNRTCYGMEISPAYCDVIVKRWENLTGEKATCQSATPD